MCFFLQQLCVRQKDFGGDDDDFWGIGKKVGKMTKTTRICMKLQEYQVDFTGYSIVPFPISNDYDRKQHFKQKQPKNKITCALDTGFFETFFVQIYVRKSGQTKIIHQAVFVPAILV